ncbi:hypothetical protein TNCV_887041 [Trichonephila clavipes]|uniref:Uncharacterized protein n=1 Tax=Trichonephila clavipes TaxID=2585209 RepID=A0A8X6RE17_TRICX|nr:hypothetical protein TNCV_887041 [Trichonephila clavipes]
MTSRSPAHSWKADENSGAGPLRGENSQERHRDSFTSKTFEAQTISRGITLSGRGGKMFWKWCLSAAVLCLVVLKSVESKRIPNWHLKIAQSQGLDLAPLDFWLFPKLKTLKGKLSNGCQSSGSRTQMDTQPTRIFLHGRNKEMDRTIEQSWW